MLFGADVISPQRLSQLAMAPSEHQCRLAEGIEEHGAKQD
jgi:hypothetical protein